jgi:hypothetical protein
MRRTMRRTSQLAGVIALTLTLGCDAQLPSDNQATHKNFGPVQAAIVDGGSGGASYLRFLPPIVSNAGALPTANDKKLNPELRICELVNGQCGAEVWSFSLAKKQPASRTLNVGRDAFEASWQTSLANLDPARTYRANATLDGHVIGFFDIDVVSNAADLNAVDKNNYLGVVRGSTVKLSFWIQSGIFTYITGQHGGTIVGGNGSVRLTVPKDATGDAHIGIIKTSPPNTNGVKLVANTYYEFLFDGMRFATPATLMIGINGKPPEGVQQSSLKLLRFDGQTWSEVPGSVVNAKSVTVSAPITGFSGYALGVLTTQQQPIVDVTINTQNPMLGSAISGVQRLRAAAAQTSCSNALRQNGADASARWVGPTTVPIVTGVCPFEGYITRVGDGYQLDALVDGVSGSSAPFNVGLPAGAQLMVDVAPGTYYAGSQVPTNAISISARNGAGQPLPFVDVDLNVTGGTLQLGGSPITSYSGRTDAGGLLTLPSGNWTLAAAPQTNTIRVSLPNTPLFATDEVITTSGAPQTIIANAMPAAVQASTPGSLPITVVDGLGRIANFDGSVAVSLNGSQSLGSVAVNDGQGTFSYNFAQPGYDNTLTLSASGLTSHTTNPFLVWRTPDAPQQLVIQNPNATSFDASMQLLAVFGTAPRAEITWRATGLPGGSMTAPLAAMFAGGPIAPRVVQLDPATRYEVQARVCTDQACSPFTAFVAGLTQPGALSSLNASAVTQNTVTLNAIPSSVFREAVFEFLYRQAGGQNAVACNTADPNCQVTNLIPGTQYMFSARACNASGCGPTTSELSITTLAPPQPPAAPTFTFVSATQTSLTFNVNNVPFNGTSPRVEVHATPFPGGTSAIVAMLPMNTAQSFTQVAVPGLLAGTMYSVTARACDNIGCSPHSSVSMQPTLQPSPMSLAITNLSATSGTLGWTAQNIPNGAPHNFQVWLQLGSGALELFSTTNSNTMALTLVAGSNYLAEVRACNASGCSASQITFATPALQPPAAPNRLQINAQAFNAITLGWADNSSNEDGFRVMRSINGAFTQVGAVGPNVTSFVDTNVFQGETVIYRVDAFNTAGSTSSNTVSTVVPAGQTTAVAQYATPLVQNGQHGVAAPQPPRVRVVNMANGAPLAFVTVTFTITSPTSSFNALVPRTAVATAVTNSQGIAVAPAWILETGTSTVLASAPQGSVTFTAIVP